MLSKWIILIAIFTASPLFGGGSAKRLSVGGGVTNVVPPSVGAFARFHLDPRIALRVEAGFSPAVSLPTGPGASIATSHLQFETQYHPWGKAFYLTGGIGYRKLEIGINSIYLEMQPPQNGQGQPTTTSTELPWTISLDQLYSVFRLGWQWQFNSKLSLNFDLGVTSSFSSTIQSRLNSKGLSISAADRENMRSNKVQPVKDLLYNTTLPLAAVGFSYFLK